MLARASSGSGGGGSSNIVMGKESFSAYKQITINTGLSDITRITLTVITNASTDYVSSFIYAKEGSTVITQAYYTLTSGGGVNNDGTKHALVNTYFAQCPNVKSIAANGDVVVTTPSAATWNAGTLYWTITNETTS